MRCSSQFEAQAGYEIQFSFAASSTLSRQIEAGANSDLFISANSQWVDHLKTRLPKLPEPIPYFGNQMVLIGSPGKTLPNTLSEWSFEKSRIAMGNPEHVPAGKYARRGLIALNLWDQVTPFLVPTTSVREALRLVTQGECEWGIVYASDAAIGGHESIVLPLPSEEKVEYQILRTGSLSNRGVDAFVEFLFSSFAEELAIKMNFQWPESRN